MRVRHEQVLEEYREDVVTRKRCRTVFSRIFGPDDPCGRS
jgi:hypothetical protein